jgi:hypothetical protein
MEFERAYDLEIEVGKEVVFTRSGDWHRKVRVLVTAVEVQGDAVRFEGHSLGSSVKDIKAAKRDEPPVRLRGSMRRAGSGLKGTLELVP